MSLAVITVLDPSAYAAFFAFARRFARKGGVALVGWTKAYLETRKFEPSISLFNPIYRKMNYNNLILILLAEWF